MKFSDHSPPLSELAQRERDYQRAVATAEVPFITVDGRRALTRLAVENDPAVAEFVRRFANCFEVDPYRDLLMFLEANELRKCHGPTFVAQ